MASYNSRRVPAISSYPSVALRLAIISRGQLLLETDLARQIGLPQWQLSKCLHQGLLPSDKLLAGLCDEYGIKYAFKIAHKCPPKPEHYEGMTAVSPRLETNTSTATPPVTTSPVSPAKAETPPSVEGAIDYEQLETQIASLEGFVFQARTSADAAAKLPAALAKVAALEIDLAASKARERNLYLDLEKAIARAETAEGHLGRIQAILPSGFSAR